MQKSNIKILLSHPSGNPNVRGVLAGLQTNAMLHSFHTSIACFPDSWLDKLAQTPLFKDFKRRSFDSSVRAQMHTYPVRELGRLFSQRLNIKSLLTHETGVFSSYKCCQYLDNKIARYISTHNDISGVYAYEDCALSQFKVAKQRGIKCIYELPTTYWEFTQKIMREEAERLPQWVETLKSGINFSIEKKERKNYELKLSDVIIVPSKFVKDTLPIDIIKNKKIVILPYGSPSFKNKIIKKDVNRPLRILFVGNMGQNKGLADVFAAIKLLNTNEIELFTIGSLMAPLEFYKKELPSFNYCGTMPHYRVLETMGTCDVFCFPSLREGRALVMQEAMSQGLPIIITPNTGGEDLVIEEKTGFLVPIRSPEKIAEKIQWFLDNRDKIPYMSEQAKLHAAQYTWEKYGNEIANTLKQSFL